MITALRCAGAIVAGIAVAMVLVVLVEMFGAIVHPFPEGFEGTIEEVCAHVERYPHWVLAVAAIAWGGAALASTWVAGRIGPRVCAWVMGLLLVAAVMVNIVQLPYPLWFKIGAPAAVVAGVLGGGRWSRRRARRS